MKAISYNSQPVCGPLKGVRARLRQVRKTGTLALLAVSTLCVTASAVADDTPGDKKTTSAVGKVKHWLETGTASWYGRQFQGHKTATGEHYDMNALTCAHRTLPLGSWIRVTNLRNRKSVFVRVNDRGPVMGTRIVDLSYAAAHAVGLDGVGKVKLESVSEATAHPLLAQNTIPLFQITGTR